MYMLFYSHMKEIHQQGQGVDATEQNIALIQGTTSTTDEEALNNKEKTIDLKIFKTPYDALKHIDEEIGTEEGSIHQLACRKFSSFDSIVEIRFEQFEKGGFEELVSNLRSRVEFVFYAPEKNQPYLTHTYIFPKNPASFIAGKHWLNTGARISKTYPGITDHTIYVKRETSEQTDFGICPHA
jgi:hypothetical protein